MSEGIIIFGQTSDTYYCEECEETHSYGADWMCPAYQRAEAELKKREIEARKHKKQV